MSEFFENIALIQINGTIRRVIAICIAILCCLCESISIQMFGGFLLASHGISAVLSETVFTYLFKPLHSSIYHVIARWKWVTDRVVSPDHVEYPRWGMKMVSILLRVLLLFMYLAVLFIMAIYCVLTLQFVDLFFALMLVMVAFVHELLFSLLYFDA